MVGEVCQTGIMNQKGFARLIIIVVIGIVLLFAFRIVSEHFLGINPIKFEGFKKQEDSPTKNKADIFQGGEKSKT